MTSQKLELHVWGHDGDLSIIDPESRACAWLLSLHLSAIDVPFEVVTSCNTNLADTRKLPVLIVSGGPKQEKHEGFYSIVEFVSSLHPAESKFIPNGRLSSTEMLVNLTLTKYIQNTFHCIHQYNMYVNSRNYSQFTRKQFSSLLPFPMYYNQPLKMYDNACEQVTMIGLSAPSSGFFGFSGPVPSTETVKDSDDEDDDEDYDTSDPIALSALHEKVILAKNKDKELLLELSMGIRCLRVVDDNLKHVMTLFKDLNADSPVEFAHLFRPTKISASEILLYAYIYSMVHPSLPDHFVRDYISEKFQPFFLFSATIIEALNECLSKGDFRDAVGDEVPSLWNELKRLPASMVG